MPPTTTTPILIGAAEPVTVRPGADNRSPEAKRRRSNQCGFVDVCGSDLSGTRFGVGQGGHGGTESIYGRFGGHLDRDLRLAAAQRD